MPLTNNQKYYEILGISPTSSIKEVKRAYKQKAKLLHPDKNKQLNANEQFVLLQIAYETICNSQTQKTKTVNRSKTPEELKKEYQQKIRKQARDIAKTRARKFNQSKSVKKNPILTMIGNSIYLLLSITLIGCPVWGYLYKGIPGLEVGIFFTLITSFFWVGIFSLNFSLNIYTFLNKAIDLIKYICSTKK